MEEALADFIKERSKDVKNYKGVDEARFEPAEIAEKHHDDSRNHRVEQLSEVALRGGHGLREHKERTENEHSAEKLVAHCLKSGSLYPREGDAQKPTGEEEKHRRAPVDRLADDQVNSAGDDYEDIRRAHLSRNASEKEVENIVFRNGAHGDARGGARCGDGGAFAEDVYVLEHGGVFEHDLGPADCDGGVADGGGVKKVVSRAAEWEFYDEYRYCRGGGNYVVGHVRRHQKRDYKSGYRRGEVAEVDLVADYKPRTRRSRLRRKARGLSPSLRSRKSSSDRAAKGRLQRPSSS